jgi:hypothetical protein
MIIAMTPPRMYMSVGGEVATGAAVGVGAASETYAVASEDEPK